jgi:glycosyltransferase involved in cell wall biosynthesis
MKRKSFLAGRYNIGEILTGPEKFNKRLLNFLMNKDISVTFLDFFFTGNECPNLWERLFGKKIVSETPTVLKLGIFRVIAYIIKNKPDVIHLTNLENFQFVFLFTKKIFHFELITTFHGFFRNELRLSKYNWGFLHKVKINFLEKLAVKLSDKLIFVSDLLAEKFELEYGKISKKVFIINNGIDDEFFMQETKKEFNEPWKFVFYNYGFIDRGLNYIYESLRKLKNYEIELHIIGESEKNILSSEKLKVFFYQSFKKDSLINFLRDKHFVIKGNTFDSFSIFVAECMACGLIPIVHNEIGISKLIKSDFNGFIYDHHLNEDLRAVLIKIFESRSQLEKISRNCSDSIKSLKWNSILDNYLIVYDQ